MQVDQARNQYIRWLLATRDLSPHTIRAYEGDLASFARYIGAGFDVEGIDRNALVAFIEAQKAEALSPASLRRRAAALRGFCRWLLSQGLISADPWSGTSLALGRTRRLPRNLATHELKLLIGFLSRAAQVDVGKAPGRRSVEKRPHESTTLLAVALMITTGVRVHEAVGIRCRDIDMPGGTMRLIGKGGRERQVFLPNVWIAGLTSAYLEARSSLGIEHARLLFNLRYEPLSPSAMRSRLAKAAEAAGISQRVTPHMLRHTAATQLIEAGVDIRYIQRLLGHASLSTTEIYTHVSDRALHRVVSDADVLGRLTEAR